MISDELRVLPMITHGATDNVKDLLYLKGIDVAFTNADVLEHFKTVEKHPQYRQAHQLHHRHVHRRVHLLVRSDINSLKDLEGKKVSFHTPAPARPSRRRSCSSVSASRSSRSTSTTPSRSRK